LQNFFETPIMIKLLEEEHVDRRGNLLAGRKLLLWALGAYLLLILLAKLIHLPWFLAGPAGIGIVGAAMLGANKVGLGLYDGPITRTVYAILMIFPFIGLAAIVVLLLRAQHGLQTTA
jgi:hypothetical protein